MLGLSHRIYYQIYRILGGLNAPWLIASTSYLQLIMCFKLFLLSHRKIAVFNNFFTFFHRYFFISFLCFFAQTLLYEEMNACEIMIFVTHAKFNTWNKSLTNMKLNTRTNFNKQGMFDEKRCRCYITHPCKSRWCNSVLYFELKL